jgi:REP element-mobilizing transposase RayT
MCQSVTFRLADAVPVGVVEQWRAELADLPESDRERDLRRRIDHYEDAGHGACVLVDRRCAGVVAEELQAGQPDSYRLHAWVVMPNHVHALIGPPDGIERCDLSRITKFWKGRSARRINVLLGRRGSLWQRESWDRWIRDERHYAAVRDYIERNPQRAGLAGWEWVSHLGAQASACLHGCKPIAPAG